MYDLPFVISTRKKKKNLPFVMVNNHISSVSQHASLFICFFRFFVCFFQWVDKKVVQHISGPLFAQVLHR